MSAAATAGVALDWHWLQPSDLDAMEALHHLGRAGMSAQLVKPESRDFLASLLHGRGQVIGACADGQLVAYGALLHDLLPSDDPRPLLHLAPERTLAKLAGACVAPHWRGQHLQRALITQRMARADSRAVLFVTAAPGNYASWRNLLACGFAVRALEVCYGGLTRYLLAYDPAAPAPLARIKSLGARARWNPSAGVVGRTHCAARAGGATRQLPAAQPAHRRRKLSGYRPKFRSNGSLTRAD